MKKWVPEEGSTFLDSDDHIIRSAPSFNLLDCTEVRNLIQIFKFRCTHDVSRLNIEDCEWKEQRDFWCSKAQWCCRIAYEYADKTPLPSYTQTYTFEEIPPSLCVNTMWMVPSNFCITINAFILCFTPIFMVLTKACAFILRK